MSTPAMLKELATWLLTSLRGKLIKIGAKIVSRGRYIIFQAAEVAVSRQMFAEILSLITPLRELPAPAWGEERSKCNRRQRTKYASMPANKCVLAPRHSRGTVPAAFYSHRCDLLLLRPFRSAILVPESRGIRRMSKKSKSAEPPNYVCKTDVSLLKGL
jgi:hypothetical protein